MADLVTTVIEAFVAVGTVGLTVLTAYQLRRDRKEALARELADRVYVPMRKDAISLQDPEALPFGSKWAYLEQTAPYLTIKVPKDLKELFDKAEGLGGVINLYTRPVGDFIRTYSSVLGTSLKIRISKGAEPLGEIYPVNIWKSGKSFTQYVEDYVARAYPLITEWSLELWADVPVPNTPGSFTVQRVGGTKETTDFVDGLFKFLESKDEAVLYRNEHRLLAEVGAKAQEKIEKQLRKRVAPQTSNPDKETGGSFG